MKVVGLISDTHGMVRPEVHTALAGVEVILHAGDVGGSDVIEELRQIAPVLAVAGNTDDPALGLPAELVHRIGGVAIHVSHGHELGVPTPDLLLARYGEAVLVYGHTHRPLVRQAEGRLVVNPGSAGARRFRLAPSVGRLAVRNGVAEVELIALSAE